MSTIPTRQHHVKTDLLREVRKADPSYERDSKIEPEYRFSNGRLFEAKTDERGAYTPD